MDTETKTQIVRASRMVKVVLRVSQTSGATYISAATCGPEPGRSAILRLQEGRDYKMTPDAQMVRVGVKLYEKAWPDERCVPLVAGYLTADGTEIILMPKEGN